MALPAQIHPSNLIKGKKYYTTDPETMRVIIYLGTFVDSRLSGRVYDQDIILTFRGDNNETNTFVWDFKSYFYEVDDKIV